MTSIKIPRIRISNNLTKSFPKDFFIGRKERSHPVSPLTKGNLKSREKVLSFQNLKPAKLNSKLMNIQLPRGGENHKMNNFTTTKDYIESESIVNIINYKRLQRQMQSNQN